MSYRKSPLKLELETQSYINNIVKNVTNAPWGLKLLQLAWTAGPVTFIALQGGYYIGFGKTAPIEIFIYFAAYTIIMGVVAVFAHQFSLSFINKRRQQQEATFTAVINYLFYLIAVTVDLEDRNFSVERRQIKMANRILQNAFATPMALKFAVNSITDEKALADIIANLEILRRSGMHVGIEDLQQKFQQQFPHHHQWLQDLPDNSKHLLYMRLQGKAPSLKEGLERPEGFINRVLFAGENDDYDFMTLQDAEHVFRLAFEFLSNRNIPHILFRYKGNYELNESAAKLEVTRSQYRAAKARFSGLLKVIGKKLIQHNLIDAQSVSRKNTMQNKYSAINEGLVNLKREFKNYALTSKDKDIQNRLREYRVLLLEVKKLWQLLRYYCRNLTERTKEFNRAVKKWNNSSQNFDTNVDLSNTKRGLYIFEEEITLNDQQKVKIAKKLFRQFKYLNLRYSTRELFVNDNNEAVKLTTDDIKQLAIDVVLVLNEELNLIKSSVQDAVESSNAANLGALEVGVSTQAIINWGQAAVSEVEKNLTKMIKKIIKSLVCDYGEELTEDSFQFFIDNYRIDSKSLSFLENMQKGKKITEEADENIPKVTEFPIKISELLD